MARRSRSRFVRPAARTKMWIGWGVGQTSLVASTQHLVATYSAGALLLRPFTILRTRGTIWYGSDQIAASESPRASLASLIVTDTAAALGITALPNPDVLAGDPEAAWFTVQQLMEKFKFSDATGWGDVGRHYDVDDHSMRKVGPDDNLVLLCTQSAGVGAELITMGRSLIQLH